MKKSKFTEQQIAFALQQVESGTTVAEVCRKMGSSQLGAQLRFALRRVSSVLLSH